LAAQAAGREESPDTTLQMEMPGVRFGTTRAEATLRPASADLRVKGDAPGNARGAVARRATVHGKCHREDTASVAYPGDSPEENLRDVFEWNATKVRVKRWGKSPPLRQQWREARQTPRGARPNRRAELARLVERARKSELPFAQRRLSERMNPRVGRSIPAARPGLEE